MPDIKQITLPNNTTYDLRDSRVDSIISQGTRWVGVTTTAISDGSTTSTIVIDGASHNAEIGDIASYNNMEFIWNGTVWQEFGSTGSLKTLAFKDSVAVKTTIPKTFTSSFSGTQGTVSVSGTTTGSVSETKSAVTVSKASSGTATYTPQGSNASSSVSGTCSVTPSGSISTGTGTANYTPAGSVSGTVGTPTISVKTAGATKSITPFGSAGTLPSCTLPTYTVSDGVLTITSGSFSAGTLPSGGTAVTVKTGDAAYQSSQPTFSGSFSGTGAELKFSGSASSGTISGTAAAQTFTGTGARLVTDSQVLTGASFTGASMTSTGNFTPAGSVTTATATTENKSGTVTYSPS